MPWLSAISSAGGVRRRMSSSPLRTKVAVAAIGDDLPGARRGKTRNADDAGDDGHELAAGEFAFDQLAQLVGQVAQAVDPGQFVAVGSTSAMPSSGALIGKARTGYDAGMRLAVGSRSIRATEGVALQLIVRPVDHSRSPSSWHVEIRRRRLVFGIDVARLRLIEAVVVAPRKPSARRGLPTSTTLPRSRTTRRLASRRVDRRCAMAIVVRPRTRLSSAFWISFSVVVSTDEVASSRIRIFGSMSSARAIEMRWRSPPESAWPRSPTSES
jgi:hypothetical protein